MYIIIKKFAWNELNLNKFCTTRKKNWLGDSANQEFIKLKESIQLDYVKLLVSLYKLLD